LEEEALDRTVCSTSYERCYGPFAGQTG
jgi:hypothetical protein